MLTNYKSNQIPPLYSRTRLLIASVTESAAVNRSWRQSKLAFKLRLLALFSMGVDMAAWDSVSTEGLLPRLGDEDVDGVERGDSCWFYASEEDYEVGIIDVILKRRILITLIIFMRDSNCTISCLRDSCKPFNCCSSSVFLWRSALNSSMRGGNGPVTAPSSNSCSRLEKQNLQYMKLSY